jgi:hypothetical protein
MGDKLHRREDYTILLWCVRRGELMLDAFFLKKLLYLKIHKFRSIVAPDLLYPELKLILSSLRKHIRVLEFPFYPAKRIPK